MLKWLLRLLLGSDSQVGDVHVYVHVDGNLRLNHDGIQLRTQESPNLPAPVKEGEGSTGTHKTNEGDIRPELFTDLGTPEVSFGRDVDLPPTGRKD